MIYLITKNREYTWRVGGGAIPEAILNNIIEVQADGHELEYLKTRFSNLPFSSGSVVRWRGGFAQFIADNFI